MTNDNREPRCAHALTDDDVGPVYARKARALNAAIQDIGMGRYQWGLFCVAGFGWCADNVCSAALRRAGSRSG